MWFKLIALLTIMTLLSGCIGEKDDSAYTTSAYTTEREIGNFIVRLNTTMPVKTNVDTTDSCMNISNSQKYLAICLLNVELSNETSGGLEKVIQNLVWEYNWFKAGARYKFLSKTEINGYQAIVVTGNPKYEATEVLAAYYPLPGTMMVVHSTFDVQETRDILNTTVVNAESNKG